MTKQDEKDLKMGHFNWDSKLYNPIREKNNINLLNQFMKEDETSSILEYVNKQWALLDSYKPAKVPNQFDGVAQGSPTSPILSMLPLRDFLSQQTSVSYADDMVFFGDKPF